MEKVLAIIEDDASMIEAITLLFEQDGFIVKSFISAEDFFMSTNRPTDCLYLVDWNLPGIKGIDIIRAIRKGDAVSPIFMVTAYDNPSQIVEALECGADDYIAKPFDYNTLLIKVKNAHKKIGLLRDSNYKSGFHIFQEAHSIISKGTTVNLTSTEFSIFNMLYKNKSKPSTREDLISALESENANASRSIDVYISSLRKKLQKIELSIETVRGVGYQLVIESLLV